MTAAVRLWPVILVWCATTPSQAQCPSSYDGIELKYLYFASTADTPLPDRTVALNEPFGPWTHEASYACKRVLFINALQGPPAVYRVNPDQQSVSKTVVDEWGVEQLISARVVKELQSHGNVVIESSLEEAFPGAENDVSQLLLEGDHEFPDLLVGRLFALMKHHDVGAILFLAELAAERDVIPSDDVVLSGVGIVSGGQGDARFAYAYSTLYLRAVGGKYFLRSGDCIDAGVSPCSLMGVSLWTSKRHELGGFEELPIEFADLANVDELSDESIDLAAGAIVNLMDNSVAYLNVSFPSLTCRHLWFRPVYNSGTGLSPCIRKSN